MTAWLAQDHETREGQDADHVTASAAELAAEYHHGAETAYQLATLAAANGQTAESIDGRQQELTGPDNGPDERTPAEREWARGYARGAESALALLRELEATDARRRQAQAGQVRIGPCDRTEPEREAGS
jgi:hypothetical protein